MTWRSNLTFNWSITVDGVIRESEVCIRADNASERGVPLPDGWKTDLNLSAPELVVDVDALADSAALRVREELSLPDDTKLDCRRLYTHARAHTPRRTHTSTRVCSIVICVF